MSLLQVKSASEASDWQSTFDLKKAIRSDLHEGYVGVKPLEVIAEEVGVEVSEIVKLDANENLYGPPKAVFEAVLSSRFHEYPDPGQTYLRKDIAAYMGVQDSQICAGAGSDDLIDIILRLARPGPVIISTPTFGMYTYLSKISKLPVIDVPLGPAPGFEVQITKIIEIVKSETASVVFIVSPNNPTGTVCPTEYIELLCKEQVFVVVDEAYAEFNLEVNLTSLTSRYPNLILLRTFSKWAALAGLRCGFAVAHASVIDIMLSTKQPYNVNVAADYAARAALAHRKEISIDVEAILKEKAVMQAEIAKFSWLHPLPSKSNFFLVKVGNDASTTENGGAEANASKQMTRTAHELWSNLRRLGILIRYFGKPPLADYVRISAGRPAETQQLLDALRILDSSEVYKRLESFRGYKAIIFDMDGVLADEGRSYRQSTVQTCAHYGAVVTLEQISLYKANGGSNDDWQATFDLVNQFSSVAEKPTLQEVTAQFEVVYQGTETVPGLWTTETLIPTRSLIKYLATQVPLGIVTGRPRKDAVRFLGQHDIAQFFKVMVCAEDAPHKPDPAPVRLALTQLKDQLGVDYDLSRVLMIGDTPNDMLAATRAGIEGMGVLAPNERNNDKMPPAIMKAGASCILGSLQELRLIFNSSQ
jgi:histidinol-phosphate aminotransferase